MEENKRPQSRLLTRENRTGLTIGSVLELEALGKFGILWFDGERNHLGSGE